LGKDCSFDRILKFLTIFVNKFVKCKNTKLYWSLSFVGQGGENMTEDFRIERVGQGLKKISTSSLLWQSILDNTGQPGYIA
jgi:hypothetical protein